ncbi:hypothetical protein Tco_0923570 [Tanacetum coccineum]|uniref:Uncharacterized protein n=1 Tax=Tanacetum coccineum TaxID=301880 RepID=A0ABQ5D4M6_9ASTR
MADANHDDVTQVTTYDQVEDDAHVTITAAHVTQKTEIPSSRRRRYLDLIKKSVNDEVKTQLPQILPKAATSLTEFELKKILIDKMEKSQLNPIADEHKELYKSLVNSYSVDKDLFLAYSKVVSSKRGRKDKDKDEEPPAGSDQGMKRRKSSKDADSLKGSSKGNTFSQPKSSGKSAQEEEPIHIVDDTEKHKRPSTPNPDWNVGKSVDLILSTKIFATFQRFSLGNFRGTDKSKITRKQSKTGKHGHENQKSSKRSQRFKAEARKVKPQSNPVKDGQ